MPQADCRLGPVFTFTELIVIPMDIDSIGQRTVLALQLAGFDAASLPAEVLAAGPEDSFELEFERPQGGSFILSHDAETACYEVEESLPPDLPTDRHDLALMLNTTLEPNVRIGKRPPGGPLVVSGVLHHDHADVASLAYRITTIGQVAQALREATPIAPDDALPTDHLNLRV